MQKELVNCFKCQTLTAKWKRVYVDQEKHGYDKKYLCRGCSAKQKSSRSKVKSKVKSKSKKTPILPSSTYKAYKVICMQVYIRQKGKCWLTQELIPLDKITGANFHHIIPKGKSKMIGPYKGSDYALEENNIVLLTEEVHSTFETNPKGPLLLLKNYYVNYLLESGSIPELPPLNVIKDYDKQ